MIDTIEVQWTARQEKLVQSVQGGKFLFYLLRKLPMGFLAGIRVRKLETHTCVTSVPYKWLNQNPFKSTYFAVQSMAAELSTAAHCLIAVSDQRPSVAFIIVDMQASFLKKATGRVFFTCNNGDQAYEAVEACKQSKSAETRTFTTVGRMADGTEVARFEFTWSFKQRSS